MREKKVRGMGMDREAFLQNIADRLNRPRQTAPPVREVRGVPAFYREKPFGEANAADQVERFRAELTALGGDVDVVDSMDQVAEVIQRLLAETQPQTVVTWHRDAFRGWELAALWSQGTVHADPMAPDFMEKAKTADIGITAVRYAIANTGTLILSTTAKQPRVVSLLPAVHVALVKESQIVSRMGEAFTPLTEGEGRGIPSSVHFITGPSRSSDIENDLSIGVHGPVAVRAIVIRGV